MIRDVRRSAVAGWAIALSVLIFSGTTVVRADSPAAVTSDAKRAASVHFRRGVELYQEGAYRAALIELNRANEIAPDYRVLYNIGQTHYALTEYVESIRAFESYLQQGGAEVPAARKDEVTNTLVELNKRVATLRITVDRDGATIAVDGVIAGKSPLPGAVALSVGRHSVTADMEDGSNASEIVDVAGGDQRTLSMTMSAPVLTEGATPPPPPTWWGKRTIKERWGYSLLATGIATGIAGGVMAGLAAKSDSDLKDALGAELGDASKINSARDDLKRNSAIADALFGTAIVTGVTGIVLVLVDLKKEKKEPEEKGFEVGFGLQSITAKGRF